MVYIAAHPAHCVHVSVHTHCAMAPEANAHDSNISRAAVTMLPDRRPIFASGRMVAFILSPCLFLTSRLASSPAADSCSALSIGCCRGLTARRPDPRWAGRPCRYRKPRGRRNTGVPELYRHGKPVAASIRRRRHKPSVSPVFRPMPVFASSFLFACPCALDRFSERTDGQLEISGLCSVAACQHDRVSSVGRRIHGAKCRR